MISKKILITGGLGFIGSAAVRRAIKDGHQVLNIDAMCYSANVKNVASLESDKNYRFKKLDLSDKDELEAVFLEFQPDLVIHFAAESHVDNSIESPLIFIKSNIVGTFNLLEVSKDYFLNSGRDKSDFTLLHVSTDEVFGTLGASGSFSEETKYDPKSPYSASKASSDHLVRAWGNTFGLPVKITNCSNNFGPHQHNEKLIPVIISRALLGEKIPIYGNGTNVRDWLFVDDHVDAIMAVLFDGKLEETYLIGGGTEISNLYMAHLICDKLDKLYHSPEPRRELIEFVKDRKGHDFRYSVNCDKIKRELGWYPKVDFGYGLDKTIEFYSRTQICEV